MPHVSACVGQLVSDWPHETNHPSFVDVAKENLNLSKARKPIRGTIADANSSYQQWIPYCFFKGYAYSNLLRTIYIGGVQPFLFDSLNQNCG